jgi:hypothetical protein
MRVRRAAAMRTGPGPRQPTTWSVERGGRLDLLRASGHEDERWVLAVDGEGRWGWLAAEDLTPIERGEAVVRGGEAGAKPKKGAANLALLVNTIFPFNGPEGTAPQYEARADASLGMPIGNGFGIGLAMRFQATGSSATDEMVRRMTESESLRAIGSIAWEFTKDWKLAAGGGYTLAVTNATAPERRFLSSRTGPIGLVTFGGQITDKLSTLLIGIGQHSRDFEGKWSDILIFDAVLAYDFNSWLSSFVTGEYVSEAGTPSQAGYLGLSAAFWKRFSANLTLTGTRTDSDLLWSLTAGLGVKF